MCFALVLLHVGFAHCLAVFRLRTGGARLIQPLRGSVPLRIGNVEQAIKNPRTPFRRYIAHPFRGYNFPSTYFWTHLCFLTLPLIKTCEIHHNIVVVKIQLIFLFFSQPKKQYFGQIWHLKIGNRSFALSSSQFISLYSVRSRSVLLPLYISHVWQDIES